MPNERNIKQIAQDFGEYICRVSMPIDENGNLQYYLCGSLATMLLSNATSIESCDIGENSVMNIQEKKTIPHEAREVLDLFARPIHDIDVINVAGDMIRNSKILTEDGGIPKKQISPKPVQKAIPDIKELFRTEQEYLNAFFCIDSLEEGRRITKHRVSRITIGENKSICISAPEALIAHKLEETLALHYNINYLNANNTDDVNKYKKDIKDLSVMISGISKIYDKKDLIQEILNTIDEKDNSHFETLKSERNNIFTNIINDIKDYISENELQNRLNANDIIEVLTGIYTIRDKEPKTSVLESAIKATEEATRDGVISDQFQKIMYIEENKDKNQEKSNGIEH